MLTFTFEHGAFDRSLYKGRGLSSYVKRGRAQNFTPTVGNSGLDLSSKVRGRVQDSEAVETVLAAKVHDNLVAGL